MVLMMLLLGSVTLSAQRRQRNVVPRTEVTASAPDTLTQGTQAQAASDTVQKKATQFTAPVTYEAKDSIVFTQDGMAHLYGSGKVNYEDIELTADVISMNMDSTTVWAHGREDSVGVVSGTPVFTEGGTPYETNSIRYNFKSKRGLISNIETQQGEGYVIGNNAKKGADDEIYLMGGRYTTCDDHEHPHFYLQMTYAKVRPKKNVVTGPAYLVVEDVPLPIAVPFFFFPFNSSYSSGFLMPTYMDDSRRGFGLTDGGYYFAISDKMDLKLTGDIFTRGSWAVNAQSNYRKRYKYSGMLSMSYQVTKQGDKGLPDYEISKDFKINWTHRMDAKAAPNTTFTASVNFSSGSYERKNIGNLYNAQAMTQNTKTSSVSFSRSFPNQKLNISMSANIAQNMKDSSIAVTLPDVNIALSTIFPFKRKNPVGNERWYEKISIRYSGRIANSITTKDDRLFKSNLIKDWKNGMKHEIPISATFTLFKYFNFTPSINYTERWYTRKVTKDWDMESQSVMNTDTVYGFHRVYNYSASASLNTKVYAMYKPLIMKKRDIQIRHIMTPTVSFTASPDFGASKYGFYDTYIKQNKDGTRDTITYSPYDGQAFGVPGRGKTGMVSFNLSNNLEMKYRDKNDSIHKISLIDEFGIGLSYNLSAKVKPWSDMSTTLRIKITKNYTFSMSSSFATYAYEFDSRGNVVVGNRTEWSYGRFGRFQGYGTSFNYTLNNDSWKKLKNLFKRKGDDSDDSKEDADTSGERTSSGKVRKSAETDEDGYQKFSIPWTLNLSTGFNIREDRSKPINRKTMRYPYKISINALNASGSVKLSNKWNISVNTGYDFESKQITQTAMTITRDLHCFTMTASVSPFGIYKYYNFTIRATSSILQDLKWNQRSQTQSNVRWY